MAENYFCCTSNLILRLAETLCSGTAGSAQSVNHGCRVRLFICFVRIARSCTKRFDAAKQIRFEEEHHRLPSLSSIVDAVWRRPHSTRGLCLQRLSQVHGKTIANIGDTEPFPICRLDL